MTELTADEARVLGVLIEKATTTPDLYPMTLNAIVNGCNQKNNRDPVITMDESAAFDALESLRAKSMVVRVDSVGSRTNKYKHNAGDALHLRQSEVALLAELMLRGPQTLGELRGRASRMHPLASLEEVKALLRAMIERGEPLVRELPPSPGSRAERYAQLICPQAYETEAGAAEAGAAGSGTGSAAFADAAVPIAGGPTLAERVTKLESEAAQLRAALRQLGVEIAD